MKEKDEIKVISDVSKIEAKEVYKIISNVRYALREVLEQMDRG